MFETLIQDMEKDLGSCQLSASLDASNLPRPVVVGIDSTGNKAICMVVTCVFRNGRFRREMLTIRQLENKKFSVLGNSEAIDFLACKGQIGLKQNIFSLLKGESVVNNMLGRNPMVQIKLSTF